VWNKIVCIYIYIHKGTWWVFVITFRPAFVRPYFYFKRHLLINRLANFIQISKECKIIQRIYFQSELWLQWQPKEKTQNILFYKPKELQLKYLAWNIIKSVSTKNVQLKTLGSKLAQPRGGGWLNKLSWILSLRNATLLCTTPPLNERQNLQKWAPEGNRDSGFDSNHSKCWHES
jgi:hypothetical protein